MDRPTYTNIWRIEKRLYKLYDLRLPMPLPLGQIAAFAGITVPYVLILNRQREPRHNGAGCTASGGVAVPPATTSVLPVSVSNSSLTYTSYLPSIGPTWVAYGPSGFSSVALFPTTLQTGMWYGDVPYGAPNWSGWGTSSCPPTYVNITTAGSSASVNMPLYPLTLKLSGLDPAADGHRER